VDYFPIKVFEAIAISCLVGTFIEVFLHREFGREVFLASVGYVLPKELRPEMRWLCTLKQMCTQDVMICSLTPIGASSVTLHVHRTQVVKNIGLNDLPLQVGLGIDEWFRREGESRILKFTVVSERQSWAHSGDPKKSEYGINLRDDTPPVLLAKGQEVTIVSEFEEIYPRNGSFFMHMKYATSGAKVTVRCPQDLGFDVNFANRQGKNALRSESDYTCPFTLLPYQRTTVRFWDKTLSAAWLAK
jgi:hypothetical protein